MEDQGEAEPGGHAKRHPEEGKGNGLQKRLAQTVDGQEVRGDKAPGHARHLLPGIEGGHGEVGEGETEQTDADESETGGNPFRTPHGQRS